MWHLALCHALGLLSKTKWATLWSGERDNRQGDLQGCDKGNKQGAMTERTGQQEGYFRYLERSPGRGTVWAENEE